MSNISQVEAKLPPGFRFHPRDDELVCDYLITKITLRHSLLFSEVDLNKCEPWDLPGSACVGGKEWYFYSLRDRKYATGLRTNRATSSGYWKATGKDRGVVRKGRIVGMRKTLVFYQGRAPKGTKTDWVMHEFRTQPSKLSSSNKEDWVLCRVFSKSRHGQQAGASSNMGNCCHDTTKITSTSPYLPPLMDSYITFHQTQSIYEQQVPCFSLFSQHQTNNPIFPLNDVTFPNPPSFFAQLPFFDQDNNDASDKNVIKAVLSHFDNIETSSNYLKGSSSDQASSESYLSDVWNNNHY